MKRLSPLVLASIVIVAAGACPARAADDPFAQDEAPRLSLGTPPPARGFALRTAAAGDTTFVGYTPGRFSATRNWWSIGAGSGAGFHRPPAQGGMWDFEATGASHLHGDSLQGWWPMRQLFTSTGGQVRPDWNRPWWAIDIGNVANYRPLSGVGRTFGLAGVWHRDFGNGAAGGGVANGVTWAPIGGSNSAWMGLRRHGDTQVLDPITGNAFNEDALALNGSNAVDPDGNDKGFPGYGSQMDQMLYRDIDLSGPDSTAALVIHFSYRLRMSTGFGTSLSTRTGWFDKDPLQVSGGGASNSATGNFISSTDAGNAGAPRDSFMVYVGAPVEGSFLASDGSTRAVYDPQRRWFSEVMRATQTGLHRELHADTGNVALATRVVTVPASVLAPMRAAGGNRVRLVFRVKTNRGFDDEDPAYSSGGAGAAVVDDVFWTLGGTSSPPGWGTFEAASSIDNATATSAVAAWKSTGKPPLPLPHPHALADLSYNDLCGQPGDISRVCNMTGVVVSMGDHDNSEQTGGSIDGTADREVTDAIVSPAIDFSGPFDGPGGTNAIGLKAPGSGAGDVVAAGDYILDYEIYTGVTDVFSKANTWRIGAQAYPAADKNGQPAWGQIRFPSFVMFDPDVHCIRKLTDQMLGANGLLRWSASLSSNGAAAPDSIRILLSKRQECYRFGVAMACFPTEGLYFDNVSLAIVDGPPAAATVQPWDLYQDTFPANDTPSLPGLAAQFDTTSAWIKTGRNISPNILGFSNRFDVPGDSAVVTAAGDPVRVDLVFRVLPGPGNYVQIGRPDLSTLRKLPNDAAPIALGDLTNFWTSFIASAGPYGTPGGHGSAWNPNVWNSARCDTAEMSVFALQGRGILGGPTDVARWATNYHESDLGLAHAADGYPTTGARAALGVARHRCFLASAGAIATDVDCVHDPGTSGAGYDLTWVSSGAGTPNPATGYDGSVATIEGTKIIPDGLLAPGAHVQYFFRVERGGAFAGLMPDTNVVYPQEGEGSEDGHRWQQFGVLPDRWKDPTYRHPVTRFFGGGKACDLVVDAADRLGEERLWVGIADTINATVSWQRGAHNGWNSCAPSTGINDPAGFVRAHGGQPGTTWDFFQIKGIESPTTAAGSLGSRLAYRDPANTQIDGKSSRQGPTPAMMSAYYKIVLHLSGDLKSGILGPFSGRSQDDVRLLRDWLSEGNPNAIDVDRGFWAMGGGFVQSNFNGDPAQDQFATGYLGVTLRNDRYSVESGNLELTPDLLPVASGPLGFTGHSWGVRNLCTLPLNVLDRSSQLVGQTRDNLKYEDAGFGPFPLLASVTKSHSPSQPWISVVDGFSLAELRNRVSGDVIARARYLVDVMAYVFAPICPMYVPPPICFTMESALLYCGEPIGCGGFPPDTTLQDYVRFANNPVRDGYATIEFGLSSADHVEARVYDVAGRRVRLLADRDYPGGQHRIVWDGFDEQGHRVARGVYFTRIRFSGRDRTDVNKLTMLR